MPDITSTFFGLTIAFVVPGFVGLFSLRFWFASAHRVFETFLTGSANFGLFLLVTVGAVALGLVVSCFRSIIFEKWFKKCGWVKDEVTEQHRTKIGVSLVAYRAAVDETYRYHQFYGGMILVAPALVIGWVNSLGYSGGSRVAAFFGLALVELVLIWGARDSLNRYYSHTKAILS